MFPRPSGRLGIFLVLHQNSTSGGFFKARCALGPEATRMTPWVPVPGKPTRAGDQETGQRSAVWGQGLELKEGKNGSVVESSARPQLSLGPSPALEWLQTHPRVEVLTGGGHGRGFGSSTCCLCKLSATLKVFKMKGLLQASPPGSSFSFPGASFPKFCFLLGSSKVITDNKAPQPLSWREWMHRSSVSA